jgi:phosphoribosyl 1,2-cyclic phosphodiesterase
LLHAMKVTFWGVRGSFPVPGPDTVRVGGNTPCVEIATSDAGVLILDAGTGIRALGLDLVRRPGPVQHMTLLLSHTHWDHIQGLPFFAPIRLAGRRLEIVGERRAGRALEQVLAVQMDERFLPFGPGDLAADLHFDEIQEGEELAVGECTSVVAAHFPHPGGVLAYRVSCRGRDLVYATDVGHPEAGPDPKLVALATGADLLIHDAHFDPAEKADHPDWGHSSWLDAVGAARAAGVGQLALFHHAPARGDEQLERIEEEARTLFPQTFLAREGMEVMV